MLDQVADQRDLHLPTLAIGHGASRPGRPDEAHEALTPRSVLDRAVIIPLTRHASPGGLVRQYGNCRIRLTYDIMLSPISRALAVEGRGLERLTGRDFASVLRFLQNVHAIRELDSFPEQVGSALEGLIPRDYYSYVQIDGYTRKAAVAITRPSIDSILPLPNQHEIFERYGHEHPLPSAHQHHVGALKISDFLTQRQFERLALYNEFFRPCGVRHQMSVVLPAKPGVLRGIIVNRGGLDFSERERQLLNLILPHLAQAYQNAEAFTLMRRALGTAGQEVIYADRGGRIRYASEGALLWIQTYFQEHAAQEDHLPPALDLWVRDQRDHSYRQTDFTLPRQPLVIDQGDKRLVIRFFRDGEDGQEDVILLEERLIRVSLATLTTLGLSLREAEVMGWVTQGKTVAEISRILCISAGTVEKHLEHIYSKLGVHSRASAVARAYQVLKW